MMNYIVEVKNTSLYVSDAINPLRKANYRSVLGVVVNIVLNLFLIERYGIIGAAWATVISYGLAAYLLNDVHPKTRGDFRRLSRTFNVFRIAQRIMNGIHY